MREMCEVVAVVGKFLPENALGGGAGAGGRAGRACAGCTENGWCGGLTGAKQLGWRVEDLCDEQPGWGPKYSEVGGRTVMGGRCDVYCSTVPPFGTEKRHTDRHRVTCDVFFGIEHRLAG